MKKVVFAVAAVFFLFVIGVTLASPSLAVAKGASATSADEPQAPSGVSPQDPAVNPPDTDGWRCPRCGAAIPQHARGGKAPYGRPELGSGWGRHMEGQAPGQGPRADRARPGRYGRAGDDACSAEGPVRMHRHFDGRAPRGGFDHSGPRAGRGGFDGPAKRGGMAGVRAGNPAERLLRNAEELKLTEEQKSALEKLSFETQKTFVDLHAQIDREQLEIKNLLQSGSDDLAAVKAHLAAASQARADLQAARVENLFAARKVLTEKQKKMIKEDFPRLGEMLD